MVRVPEFPTYLRLMVPFFILAAVPCGRATGVVPGDQEPVVNPSLANNCTTSHLDIGSAVVSEDVFIAPFLADSNNEFPKMSVVNASAWELWYFDGVSTSGDGAAVTISFFRDGAKDRKTGKMGFRTQVHAIWADGETFGTEDFAPESIVEECGHDGLVTAAWLGPGKESRFEVAKDLTSARLEFALPAVKGTISLRSTNAAPLSEQSAEGFETAEAMAMLAQAVHWLQPMPAASVEVSLTIGDRELSFAGRGGHDRFWTPHSWMTLMDESYYLRANLGPYTILLLRIISRLDRGRSHVSAFLYKDGERVFATKNDNLSLIEDYFSFKLTYHGSLRGTFRDANTGYVVEFVSPHRSKHWRFEVDHSGAWWNFPTGQITGNSGFVDAVSGGEVGAEQYKGWGGGGQCQLPQGP